MLLSQLVNGAGLIVIGATNLATPVLFTQTVNAALRGLGLGALTFPDDGSGAGHYGKVASFAIMYIGSLYFGLGWRGSKEFARYSIMSRLFVYPVFNYTYIYTYMYLPRRRNATCLKAVPSESHHIRQHLPKALSATTEYSACNFVYL